MERVVERVVAHLRGDYRYSLEVGDLDRRDPLADFLFNKEEGWCEYFATAAAILLRTRGIPTRYVSGFNVIGSERKGDYYLVYANRVRETYRPENTDLLPGAEGEAVEAAPKKTLSKRWQDLICRIYEVDPLTCSRCRARMKILAFIINPKIIRQILDHLERRAPPRAPPDLSRKP